MTKRIITCLISLMLSITSSVAIFANENVNELTIDESNGYTTKLCYDDDSAISVNTYKDGELIFSSYTKSDGNIYMLIDGKEVLAVEMEGAAIAQAAHAAGRPFMVIRAMSDTADHAANISFDEFIVEAGERSAQTLITFLKRLV